MNEIWRRGLIPKSWKTAYTEPIPKPGKALSIDNLRPISLTSCVGKMAEHVMLNRLTDYIESNDCYTHNMIGFRSGLSTQDAMMLIKHQIIDCTTADTKGTPQGAVISPTLFNISMINLLRALNKILNMNYTIYVDDITIWCPSGCEEQVEGALQEAIDVTERYFIPTGLSEETHSAARGLTDRAPGNASSAGRPEPLSSYKEICLIKHRGRTCTDEAKEDEGDGEQGDQMHAPPR
ncbi:uncharacterized protein LOC119449128 [Dermacentor silvarum]|uniref:uncharacterized protein LOC119449128 n=1 Tax=Dermacentor silvarum TaxID=543639 RepID=UPI001896B0EE|nr:uncharacterized protein LOC119449128 [Dermacentor silvarum]